MYSVLKFNSSNNRSGSPKCWRIVGLSGTSREVEIFTVEGYNLTNLSWYRLEGCCAELLWVSSLCSCFAVNHFLDVAVGIFLTYANYKIYFWAVDVHMHKPMCGKAWWINVIKSLSRKGILKPHVRPPQ